MKSIVVHSEFFLSLLFNKSRLFNYLHESQDFLEGFLIILFCNSPESISKIDLVYEELLLRLELRSLKIQADILNNFPEAQDSMR